MNVSAAVIAMGLAATSAPQHAQPWRSPTAIVPEAPSCTLTYYGGPVLQNPKVYVVFWGVNVETQVQTTMAAFYGAILQSPYWDWLSEYNTAGLAGTTTNQGLSRGTVNGTVTLTPSIGDCPGTGCSISDAQIQSELSAQILAGNLPAPTLGCDGQNDTVYMIHFPPLAVITDSTGNPSCNPSAGTTGQAFCAYHGTGRVNGTGGVIAYGVIPSMVSGPCAAGNGCGTSATLINNETTVASHELAEAATDTDVGLATAVGAPLGWISNTSGCGEIGDICNGQQSTVTVNGATWTVQKLWSNALSACIAAKSTLPPICSAAGQTGCRVCTCADDNASGPVGCNGATPWCETAASNIEYGFCVQCTTDVQCASGSVCAKSAAPATDDTCVVDAGVLDAGVADAGGSTADAGTGAQDAGMSSDAGGVGRDGGAVNDAGAASDGGTHADAGVDKPASGGGCGCGEAEGGTLLLLLLLGVLAAGRHASVASTKTMC